MFTLNPIFVCHNYESLIPNLTQMQMGIAGEVLYMYQALDNI